MVEQLQEANHRAVGVVIQGAPRAAADAMVYHPQDPHRIVVAPPVEGGGTVWRDPF